MKDAYARAGVDISEKNRSNRIVGKLAKSTFNQFVVSEAGFFNGMFEFKGYREPLLVSSTDSVGTKTKIAIALGIYDTVGIDIVNHCINDIFTCGAKPIFFLDYIGIGKLVPERVEGLVSGCAVACKKAGCVLIGGETAELSDVYSGDDYDLAGFIIGAVEKETAISGKAITAGDVALGMPSSGLHTNGYTLARKIFGDTPEALKKSYPELGRPVGEALLEPHRSYYSELSPSLPLIKGMAHITGGGLIDNVPRIIPEGLAVRFDGKAWDIPPVFQLMEKLGNVDHNEMYHVFNMGIGMVVVCAPENAAELRRQVPELMEIGKIIPQSGDARVTIE